MGTATPKGAIEWHGRVQGTSSVRPELSIISHPTHGRGQRSRCWTDLPIFLTSGTHASLPKSAAWTMDQNQPLSGIA
jgi:hypothetical protein